MHVPVRQLTLFLDGGVLMGSRRDTERARFNIGAALACNMRGVVRRFGEEPLRCGMTAT